MNDPATLNTANTIKERRVKELKRQVEGWREIIVMVQSVLIWELSWYPGLIFGVSTFLFLFIWFLDPSLLTTVSVACLLTTILELFIPTCSTTCFNPANWTGNKERQLEEFCRTIVDYKTFIISHWTNLQQMKTTQPKLYYPVMTTTLGFLAWLGNWNNLVLSYFFITGLLMLPGLIHHGFVQKYYTSTLLAIASILRNLTGDKVKTK